MQLPWYADCAVGCGKTISGRKIEDLKDKNFAVCSINALIEYLN